MDIEAARAREDEKRRASVKELMRRALKAGHEEAITICGRYLGGDESVADDIQQGMRSWGL